MNYNNKKQGIFKGYIRIARVDHWIKQLFTLPGMVFAFLLVKVDINTIIFNLLQALLATSFVASANYVINEWLDAKFDQYHPTKKDRPVVSGNLKVQNIIAEYVIFAALGLSFAAFTSKMVFIMNVWLLIMGIIYNVRPLRTKELPYLDVLSESVNNAIRLLIGWFSVTEVFYPPVSIVFGYWMGGAFLMAMKRYSEYRMIGNKEIAGSYRKSFQYYTEKSLLISAFFYALLSVFFCGIFMIKYKIELILDIPLLCGLFCLYLNLSYKKDSCAQKPEKLFHEKGLMFYLMIFIMISAGLLFIKIPVLDLLLSNELIGVG